MFDLLSRFRRATRRPEPVPRPVLVRRPNAGWYRAASCRSLSVGQIRQRRFGVVRRGLDPAEVYGYLHRVAGELAVTRRDLATLAEENARIKAALHGWPTRFAPGDQR
ncbi:cell division protein DivIVA [Micromonospora rosaria]|uniref:Cell division protein DivIVA n=1 Tax=Micromonospora rosaria TaxID=47874 RepID=A0A136PU52_9ACTN|nr:DivIVA domain-containing protein [Micromonospora rosaria]KXK61905.1 cell division protein DivIVA [Micromonospora rosaria]